VTKSPASLLALITCLSGLPLMVGQTGCTGDRHNQNTEQAMNDSRTAERVREALAAASEYKFDGVQVAASNGVVQLSGFVNTRAQRQTAGEVAATVEAVKSVVNDITPKE
jgi:hyperosmotically inducible periplasmic protein